ncbi:MAG: ATP-binding protein [Burkholderiales bacterium]
MKFWPKSLRMRLILSVTFAMVVTHLLVLLAIAEVFGREQRLDRAQQMARLVAFIKPRIEAQTDLPLDQPLSPPSLRGSGLFGPPNGSRDGPPGVDRPPPPRFESGKPERGNRHEHRPPLRELPTMLVTAASPDGSGDPELLALVRETVPEIVQVAYFDLAEWPGLGPERRYRIESWTRLSTGKFLKTVVEDTGFHKDRAAFQRRPEFAVVDLGLRIAIGVLLALLIMGWISKPLARLTASVDATLPNGELRPGAPRVRAEDEPTEIAHTLAAIERMRQRISAMLAERTTMLTALAHDLRTPLTRLMLRLELADDAKLREEAVRDCEKMQTLVARTLDFIRSSESGGTISAVGVGELIGRVLNDLPPEHAQRIDADFEGVQGLTVAANEWGLERVLANLLDNALKHSPPNQVIDLTVTADDSRVCISVRDRGPGVPEATLGQLKQPFFRVDSARNADEGGVGLGLSIVDNLMRAYGGEVSIANHPDGGLVVTLALPRPATSGTLSSNEPTNP